MNLSFYTFLTWLLIPVLQILTGWIMKNFSSSKPNFWLGYRSRLSMKNQKNWQFANHYAGALYMRIGLITVFIPVVLLLILMHSSRNVIDVTGTIIMILQVLLLILPIFSVEKQLKTSFQ